jgi:hypothetical protein
LDSSWILWDFVGITFISSLFSDDSLSKSTTPQANGSEATKLESHAAQSKTIALDISQTPKPSLRNFITPENSTVDQFGLTDALKDH